MKCPICVDMLSLCSYIFGCAVIDPLFYIFFHVLCNYNQSMFFEKIWLLYIIIGVYVIIFSIYTDLMLVICWNAFLFGVLTYWNCYCHNMCTRNIPYIHVDRFDHCLFVVWLIEFWCTPPRCYSTNSSFITLYWRIDWWNITETKVENSRKWDWRWLG